MRVLGSDGDAGGVTVPPASAFTQVCVSMGVLLSGVLPAARQVDNPPPAAPHSWPPYHDEPS